MIQITLLTEHVCLKIRRERAREEEAYSHSGGSQEVSAHIKRDQNKSKPCVSHVPRDLKKDRNSILSMPTTSLYRKGEASRRGQS